MHKSKRVAVIDKFVPCAEEYSITLPGSKSLSLRALFLAALASEMSIIHGVADCDDTSEMISALEIFGCRVEKDDHRHLVYGTGGRFREGKLKIEMKFSGTSTRFFIALSFLRDGVTEIDGHESLRVRPNKYLIEAIQSLGASVSPSDASGLPVSITGGANAMKSTVKMSGDRSSQFFSALLQIAPLLPNGIKLDVIGELVSKPYVDITIALMKIFGVQVERDETDSQFHVEPQTYKGTTLHIEGDASGGSYFAALATIHGVAVKFSNLGNNSRQGDYQFIKICERLGAEVTSSAETTSIRGPIGGVRELWGEIDMEDMPDVAPTLMAIAPLIPGGVKIRGLTTLRIKECDRLAVSAEHLRKLGVVVKEEYDRIEIQECREPISHIVDLDANNDHRMAMSFAVLASKWGNIRIVDSDSVTKTFTTFWQDLADFGVQTRILAD
jgi:3-phosphoshikimate 1-carboxyvinyltransferase